MRGFKSFARKTEIPFTQEINVILGPNGSGKSNISDALCFVLGRLSIKSMRASKASNLIFMGSKEVGPAKEASVTLVFDNSTRSFALDSDELILERIVRTNGQSIYRINNETRTRQEVLELLAQAGIDPHGFNIVLQGEIQNFVRMNAEERRKIIEEVAGISIYESRKEKTLKELDKTEEKLKEVHAILRERTSYLNNLEKERQQALKFKQLQTLVRQCKASIINYDLKQKEKELGHVEQDLEKKLQQLTKAKNLVQEVQQIMQSIELKITEINAQIRQATGVEQETINREIADRRAMLAGLQVKKENFEKRLKELQTKYEETKKKIIEGEKDFKSLEQHSPSVKKKQEEFEKKKQLFEILEKERKKWYMVKAEFKSVKERLEDKSSLLQNLRNDVQVFSRQVDLVYQELYDKDTAKNENKLLAIRQQLHEQKNLLHEYDEQQRVQEKLVVQAEFEMQRLKKVRADIEKLDICPLCKNVITEEHLTKIDDELSPQLNVVEQQNINARISLKDLEKKKTECKNLLDALSSEIVKRESDAMKIHSVNEKQQQLKTFEEKRTLIEQEIKELDKKRIVLEKEVESSGTIEEKYETARLEMQESLLLQSEQNYDSEMMFKKRELERSQIAIHQMERDQEESHEELGKIEEILEREQEMLSKKVVEEEELSKRFKKFFNDRDKLQDELHEKELQRINKQQEVQQQEQEMNEIKISKARIGAETENLQIEFQAFIDIELIKGSREHFSQRMQHTQATLETIGSVNLRSLEVYDAVKQEYDSIQSKVETLQKEKDKILSIIHEIDIKKKKTFLRTLESINQLFSENFAQLSTKGEVLLDLENKQEPFEGGLYILVKVGKGKYFDVTSLSGGEQTLVALSLIFAIQEHKPYAFYILDEIDAALDKRNSQRLAHLLKKYMTSGQYLVITHNDEIISNASALYGVSMHEGISKIISMKLEPLTQENQPEQKPEEGLAV